MAAAVMFDTQKYVKKLQAGQFSPEQAEAQSEAMREVLESAFASHAKEQQEISARAVNELDSKTEKALIKLDAKIDNVALGLKKDLTSAEERLNAKIDGMRKDIIIWLGGLVIAGFVILGGMLIKLLP